MAATAAAAPAFSSSRVASVSSPEARTTPAPLFAAAIAFAVGIGWAKLTWNPASWWLPAAMALLLLAGASLGLRHLRLAKAVTFAGIVALGAFTAEISAASAAPWKNNNRFSEFTDGREVTVTAHVTRAGNFEGGVVRRESLDLITDSIESGGQNYSLNFGLRLSVYGTPFEASEEESLSRLELPHFEYGQRVRFTTHLRQPRNFMDAGAFDYRGFLEQQGVVALASVRADRVEILPGFSGTRLGRWRSTAQQSLVRRIQQLWPGRDGELMSALLLGDRTGVDRETTLDYQRTGAYHILVVAGLKVGILAAALLWLLKVCRVPEVVSIAVAIAATSAYTWITDANTPAVRATLMLAVYLLARFFYRERDALNAVGLAGLLLLISNPRALWEASFQLTFVSILAIAGIALPLMERSSGRLRRALRNFDSTDYDFALSPALVQLRLDLRLIAGRIQLIVGRAASRWLLLGSLRIAAFVYDLLLLSAILQLALALPMAYYFHRAITLGLPANALVVPLHAALLPLAGLAVLFSYFSLGIAHALAAVPVFLLHATNYFVAALAHWRFRNLWIGDLRVATPSVTMAIGASTALIFGLWAARRRFRTALGSLVLLTAAAIWLAIPPAPHFKAGVLEFTALDVGQGDSLLLVTPSGKTLLIDAGGELGAASGSRFDMGEEVVSPALWARGITRLDAVALTHAHADHIGGMRSVIQNFHPAELWLGPDPDTSPMRALLQEARLEDVTILHKKVGDTFSFGGADLQVLGPPADWQLKPDRAQNNDSLVMRASYGANSILLEGDAEKKIERELAGEAVAADILKVAHHGSASSSTLEMISAVHPRFAVISSGFRNAFHHPRPEVLERLEAEHARTFRTDTMGAVTFWLDGKRVSGTVFSAEK